MEAYKARKLEHRNTQVKNIMQYFEFDYLIAENAKITSQYCHELAWTLVMMLSDGTELITGLRKLLEAKDCFVRASL